MFVVVDNTNKRKQFLPKLLAYLTQEQVPFTTVRTLDELRMIPQDSIHGIILSGSNQNIQDVSADKYLMNVYAITLGCPLLGICFGAQFIHVYHGGQLVDQKKTTCYDMEVRAKEGGQVFKAKFCNRYTFDSYNLCHFDVLAEYNTPRGSTTYACMFKHKKKPLWGVLFHPEDHPHTQAIIGAFIQKSTSRFTPTSFSIS